MMSFLLRMVLLLLTTMLMEVRVLQQQHQQGGVLDRLPNHLQELMFQGNGKLTMHRSSTSWILCMEGEMGGVIILPLKIQDLLGTTCLVMMSFLTSLLIMFIDSLRSSLIIKRIQLLMTIPSMLGLIL